jgi:HK97 family phage portal protein
VAKQRTNIFKRVGDAVKRAFSLSGPTSFEQFFNLLDDEVIIVNPETAKSLSAVFTCLQIRSQDFAQLPKGVYSKSNGTTTHHVDHTVNTLINYAPNKYETAYDFWNNLIQDRDSYGRGLAIINRDGLTNAVSLHRIKPWLFKKLVIRNDMSSYYEFTDGTVYESTDVLEFKSTPDGKSPLRTNKDTIGLAKQQEQHAKKITGQRPPAVLSSDGPLTPEQMKDLREQFQNQIGTGKTPVLPQGMKYIPTMLPAGEVDLIEAMRLTAHQIYGLYRVPPTMAGDYTNSPYGSAEHQDLVYVKYGLMPGIVQAEQEIKKKLLNRSSDSDKYIKINVNGLLRGDIATRNEAYAKGVTHGWLSPNDVRALEDMDRIDGGDQYFIQGAYIPLDKIGEFYEAKGMM